MVSDEIGFSVNRIQVEFVDEIGNVKLIVGTGFWVSTQSGDCFVTNKHNLDPSLKLGLQTKFKLKMIKIELRKVESEKFYPDTTFYSLKAYELYLSKDADCAVLAMVEFENRDNSFQPYSIKCNLAGENFFGGFLPVETMDSAVFIGFPNDWFDQKWNYPIARMATIASLPTIPFTHPAIKTSDVVLVSGYSFSGSSGSPIILITDYSKIPDRFKILYPKHTVIGIMSGHFQELEPSIFNHSGLSYYTRANSIVELLESNDLILKKIE
ncbi:hypothetical protein L6Q79_16075 [bacterium]|nr:hypothetical protein [bacterium]